VAIEASKRRFVVVNVVGGAAVLLSYGIGLVNHPDTRGELWGGVPDGLRAVYTVCMLLAAVGYFPFTSFILLRFGPTTLIAGRFGMSLVNGLYAAILASAALWMPLTFIMLEQPGAALWLVIRLVLATTGVGSVALLVAFLTLRPRPPGVLFPLAVVGLCFFCIQTAVLDALVWPAYFAAP
jgi:hypothetical protein